MCSPQNSRTRRNVSPVFLLPAEHLAPRKVGVGSHTPSAMSRRQWAPSRVIPSTRGVGAVTGGAYVGAGADHGQHPAAGRDDPAVLVRAGCRRAGRRSRSAVPPRPQPVDRVAGARRLRVALGRDDHRHGGVGRPLQRPERRRARRSAAACSSDPSGRAQPGQHHLGLRVAEAGVELDHPHPARGQRQPGVEQPGERRAPPRHLVDRRLQHCREHLVDQAGAAPTAAASRRPCRRCSARCRRRRPA